MQLSLFYQVFYSNQSKLHYFLSFYCDIEEKYPYDSVIKGKISCMSVIVALLILLSTLFHVSWNVLGKRRIPSAAFFMGTSLFAVVLFLPVYLFVVSPVSLPVKAWSFLVPAGIFQSIYYLGLSGGYKNGDMSYVYPLARALPVLFIPIISILFHVGSGIAVSSGAGMFLVFFGCVLLPVDGKGLFHLKNYFTKATLFSFIAAFGTTGYTFVDSEGVQYLSGLVKRTGLFHGCPIPLVYIAYEMLIASFVSSFYVILKREERKNFFNIIKNSKLSTALAGLFILIAYGIILMVYPLVTNVSFVTAFRQISIPLGALGGIVILKEKMSPGKIAGSLVIFLGLVFVYV